MMPKPGGCHSFGISLGDAGDGPSGIRHGGGAKLNRALVWNVRTCRTDAKEEVTSGQSREDESTDAEHRGGAASIRDEGSVMELDPRVPMAEHREPCESRGSRTVVRPAKASVFS